MKNHVAEREERDFKVRVLYGPPQEKASLIYFLQNGQSSIRCVWTSAVPGHGLTPIGGFTKYGEREQNLPNILIALLGTRQTDHRHTFFTFNLHSVARLPLFVWPRSALGAWRAVT